MRARLLIITGLLAASVSMQAQAQTTPVQYAGRLITAPTFGPEMRLLLSQSDRTQGTARSTAMGGAFTSLGADLSSMSINPAGLGMYQSSDWGITQTVAVNLMETTAPNMPSGDFASSGSRVSYNVGNFGAAFNLFNSSGMLTSMTLGLAHNRVANFNSRTTFQTKGERASVAEMFQNQLNGLLDAGIINKRDGDINFNNEGILPEEWGAVFGYNSWLVDENLDSSNNLLGYSSAGSTPNDATFSSLTRGGIDEYGISLGMNIDNVVYLGATMDAVTIDRRENMTYRENYSGMVRDGVPVGGMTFDQRKNISGWGFTAKFGAIVRPVPALRLGVSFHLPTYYNVQTTYNASMTALKRVDLPGELVDRQRYQTAPRLLAGASVLMGDRAVLAVDYEAAWYNLMRMRDDNGTPLEIEASRSESKSMYKPAHSVRAGLEVRATENFALRLGGGYNFDFMRQGDAVVSSPTPRGGYSVSGGVGFNLGKRCYMDITYLYNRTRYTPFELYRWESGGPNGLVVSQYDTVDGHNIDRAYHQTKDLHQISVTLGGRF